MRATLNGVFLSKAFSSILVNMMVVEWAKAKEDNLGSIIILPSKVTNRRGTFGLLIRRVEMTNFLKSHREGRFSTATILLILITMAFVPIMGSAQETSFVLARIFQNPSPNVGDEFDHAVAIDGNNVLIGAGMDDTIAEDAGIAYLFDVDTGQLLRARALLNRRNE